MVHGGNPRWIGYCAGNTDEHVYWQDGSYVEVCNEMYPGKVSWASRDHSAITTATPGRWISKWNEWPLVEHDWNDTPFGSTDLKYYVSNNITGSTALLCSGTRTINAPNIAGATYTWSVNSSVLTIVSGQGTKDVVVQQNGSNSGSGWVEVTISTPCSSTSATSKRIEFHVGSPTSNSYTIVKPGYVTACVTESKQVFGLSAGAAGFNIEIENVSGAILYNISDLYTPVTTVTLSGFHMQKATGFSGSYITLRVRTGNACGWTSWSNINVPVCESSFMMSPNPASDLVKIQPNSEGKNAGYSKIGIRQIKVVDNNGDPKEAFNYDGKINETEVDIKRFDGGIYYIEIITDRGIERHRLLIIR